jgi:hypothetical protein
MFVYLQANQKEEEERVAEIKVLHMHLMIPEKIHLMPTFVLNSKLNSTSCAKNMTLQMEHIALTFSTFDVNSIQLIS